ncbi:DUF2231 domain-containing protein [Cellulomonas shaoxiangyii]|uniref:DUF2231 domain-containing protein n=1 Tax=Cellulomonas shaoxiangyii TaxID=2566013 RepID=A0A4P7SFQ6_9CELL|nr:DUF2231 domain-containing protein [Cellulomonas shaoxiangyii]QCB92398.1 hypothetical protein E5225_01355 [Cellulomonas shaoxiangyii]TGY82190.1 hypothetical protein E5226_13375 [Cellulomonas shaoxiangyii]
MSHSRSSDTDNTALQWAHGLEADARLDRPVAAARAAYAPLLSHDRIRGLLNGEPIGHALHPLMTDLPLGLWISATTLDLVGGEDAEHAADRLLGLGVLAALPTALTGAADWFNGNRRVQRVGAVHAALNSVGLGMYAGAYLLRKKGRRGLGKAVVLAAGAVVGVSGYLGGHMTIVQKYPEGGLAD